MLPPRPGGSALGWGRPGQAECCSPPASPLGRGPFPALSGRCRASGPLRSRRGGRERMDDRIEENRDITKPWLPGEGGGVYGCYFCYFCFKLLSLHGCDKRPPARTRLNFPICPGCLCGWGIRSLWLFYLFCFIIFPVRAVMGGCLGRYF